MNWLEVMVDTLAENFCEFVEDTKYNMTSDIIRICKCDKKTARKIEDSHLIKGYCEQGTTLEVAFLLAHIAVTIKSLTPRPEQITLRR